jgi:hypothetical protein
MAKRNAFLTKMQARHEHEAKTSIILAEKWTRQAALDALVLTLGYGECMGTPWGAKRIKRFVDEWVPIFLWVLKGAQAEPDSDAIRAQVDARLKPKVPPDIYGDWAHRYPGFISETIAEEQDRLRAGWKRDGMDTDGGATEDLLRDLRGGC